MSRRLGVAHLPWIGGLPRPEADAVERVGVLEQPEDVQGLLGIRKAAGAAPLVADALIANYAGDETPSAQTQGMLSGLVQSTDPALHTLGLMLSGIWTDLPPSDNQLVLPFPGN